MYRIGANGLEVLLAHPGGPFYARRDEGVWSIPKGEPDRGEDLFQAALREFTEEMGQSIAGDFVALHPRRQPGGKVVHIWAVRADFDPALLRSNTFSMEWPPRSGTARAFPEIDRAEWFSLDIARIKILKGQLAFLDELVVVVAR